MRPRWCRGACGTAPLALRLLAAAAAAAPAAATLPSGLALASAESPTLARTSAESELLAAAKAKLGDVAASGRAEEGELRIADAGHADLCADPTPVDLRIDFTVFGALGLGTNDTRRVSQEVLERARQWIIEAIMRTMMDDAYFEMNDNGEARGVRRTRTEAPKEQPSAAVHVIEPFEEDSGLPPGVVDQRSAFLRTRWHYRFPAIPLCDAAEFAYRLCDRYPSESKEFLASVLRSLDMAKLYPIQALQIASSDGRDLMSFLHLSVSLINAQGDQLDNMGCNADQRRAGSEEGFFFLPPCPKDSTSCYQNTAADDLCTEEEKQRFGICKCNVGYEGTITLPDMSAGGSFVGTCQARRGYCWPGNEGEEGSWERAAEVDGSRRAAGTVGEIVRPVCLQGFYPSGTAICSVDSMTGGRYVPDRFCEARLGSRPAVPDCAAPGGDVLARGCDSCLAIEDNEEESRQRCDCVVSCAPGFKETGRPGGPTPRCTLKGLECPETLLWKAAEQHCVNEATGERTQDFCCGEAWQRIQSNPDATQLAMEPPLQLTVVESCATIRRISVCYSSAEVKDGHTLSCCWRQQGWGGTGAQCAPENREEFGTKDALPGQCAVARVVPVGEWTGLPQCVAKCVTPVVPHGSHLHCEDCVPGEDEEACPCSVACNEGFWHLGGGPTGPRRCGDGLTFGDMPICAQLPDPPVCPSLEASLVASPGCQECRGGVAGCQCTVSCAAGHLVAKDSAHQVGQKDCVSAARAVPFKACEEITTAEECLGHQEERLTGPPAPCCWRAEGFGAGGPAARCVALGSPLIHRGALPDGYSGQGPIIGCARLEEGQWVDLPTCKPVCDAAQFNQPGVVAESCQACFAGEECPECQISCREGYLRYGGGEIGNYKCSAEREFGPPPVCRRPEAGEAGGEPPTCEAPVVANADIRRCWGCAAGVEDGCACDVLCLPRFKNILADVAVGPKRCNQVPHPDYSLVDDCGQAADEATCVKHHQGEAACCWVPAGPGAGAEGSGRCLARGSRDITTAPKVCAKAFAGSWDPMPQCEPLCDTAPLRLDQQRNLRREALAGCDECVADHQPCACEATCDEFSVRVGGGAEGARSCTKENLRFEDAPLCRQRPPPPRCLEASEGTAHPAGSLVFSGPGCRGCEAGQQDCRCDVACASGFAAAAADPDEGNKVCEIQEISAEVDACDAPGVDCLNSKEKGGTPCCWRPGGFGEDGEHGTCLKQGDDRITLATPPTRCARTHEGRWQPFPNCQALCIWSGSSFLVPSGCNGCFRDPQFGACDCSVTCRGGSGNDDESRGPPPWKLPCNSETGLFENQPNCVPVQTNNERFCERPSDEDGSRVVQPGCGQCSNKEGTSCECEVGCAPNYKLMSGEAGPRTCVAGEYDCPRTTRWVSESRTCEDAVDSRKVDVACCTEFVFTGVEGFKPEPAECTTYSTAEECMLEVEVGHKRECCFQGKGFGRAADAPKCVAPTSELIGPWSDTTSPASACWNRPPVSSALWDKPMPTCSRRCADIFTPMRLIQAEACDDCALEDPNCKCTVSCATGAQFYGGPPPGPRACVLAEGAALPAFERAPVCGRLDDRPLACPRPEGEGLSVVGCNGCAALSSGPVVGCACRVQCELGYLPEGGASTVGAKSCQQVPMELTERPCTEISGEGSRDVCLSSQQKNAAGELVPCCYHERAWAHDDQPQGVTCAMQGDPRAYEAPQACAVPFKAAYAPALPVCKRECTSTFASTTTRVTGCRDCFLGGSCSCSVQCRVGLEYKGGGAVGDRTCSEDPTSPTGASFGPSPLCGPPEPIRSCDFPSAKQYTVASACKYCEPDDPCNLCQISCSAGHAWDGNSASPEGHVKCVLEQKPAQENECESFAEASACTERLEGEKPCCWQEGEGTGAGACYPMGDSRFVRLPAKCATSRRAVWKVLPSCVEACKFPDPGDDRRTRLALENVEVGGDCTKCAPGRSCPGCSVKCRRGTERFGGGPEGSRACSLTDSDDSPAGVFPMKPLCWKPEPVPVCPRPITNDLHSGPRGLAPDAGIIAKGCARCEAGAELTCCEMTCANTYSLVSGRMGYSRCELADTPPYNPKEDTPCSSHQSEAACRTAVEWADAERTASRACCWREKGYADGAKCAGSGSKAVTLGALPDSDEHGHLKCAPMKHAAFRRAPVCEPACTDIFASVRSVDAKGCENCMAWPGTYEAVKQLQVHSEPSGSAATMGSINVGKHFEVDKVDRRQKSDHFIWGRVAEGQWVQIVEATTGEESAKKVGSKDCKCTVGCNALYRLHPSSSLPEGARVCRLDYATNKAKFPAEPRCGLACENPGHADGTRSISGGCSGDSFCTAGDDDCKCMVGCRPGSERVGGRIGRQYCTRIGGTYRAWYPELPTCNPQCETPNNQGGALNVNRCRDVCDAQPNMGRDPDCRCEMFCATSFQRTAGAPEGTFRCAFVPGTADVPARAEWRHESWRPDGGVPVGVPLCIQEFWVQVVDAQTDAGLEGASVTLYTDSSRTTIFENALRSTDSAGNVRFPAGFMVMELKIEHEGFVTMIRSVVRSEVCSDTRDCGVKISLVRKLEDGELVVRNNHCFLASKERGKYEFRAVLEWGARDMIADMDILGRYLDCGLDTEERWGCAIHQNPVFVEQTGDNWETTTCPRHNFFSNERLRASEARSCGMYECVKDRVVGRGETTRMDSAGNPICPTVWDNSFAKWVNHQSRLKKDLQMRMVGRGEGATVEVLESLRAGSDRPGWPSDNYISVDVDAALGHGPETLSFKHVPPGTYQVAVSKYSQERGRTIEYGNPRIRLYLGSNAVFDCRIPPSCDRGSDFWNALNIRIFDESYNRDEGVWTYRVEILDHEANVNRLSRASFPTFRQRLRLGSRFNANVVGFMEFADYWLFLRMNARTDPSQDVLDAVCTGQCDIAPGADPEMRKCIPRLAKAMRAAGFNMSAQALSEEEALA